MSDVKTFRCDICGKTFLSDEHKKLFIVSDLTGEGKCYEHICTSCNENLARVITVPNSIRDLEGECNLAHVILDKVENLLNDLRNKLFGWKFLTLHADITMQFDNIVDRTLEIEHGINELKTSRNVWKSWAIGLLAGNVLACILSLIF